MEYDCKRPPINAKFGFWTVLGAGEPVYGRAGWLCRCQCGKEKSQRPTELISGQSKSCGCNKAILLAKRRTTHGASRSKDRFLKKSFKAWEAMRRRCYSPNDSSYKNYGGRGITVCDQWKSSFEVFLKDMGLPPTLSHSVDRMDTNGNYEPLNCKWSTPKEQGNNRRTNLDILYKGEVKTLPQIAEDSGIPYKILFDRFKYGWDIERAASTPVRKRSKNHSHALK